MNCPDNHQNALKEALLLNKFEFDIEIINKFNQLIELTLKWAKTINITAHRDPSDIIYKDIIDNLYLYRFIDSHVGAVREPPLRIIDMGAGAGFSGIVLSIVNPAIKMAFLESDRKKINFIKEACRQLGLHQMQCFIHTRAELKPQEYKEAFNGSITRATWPLEEYLKHAFHYVQNSGHIFFMSGKKEKNHSPEMLKDQGFAEGKEFFYKIEPKRYERSILVFKKMEKQVPRGNK